mgnify:CR=1 FL=1
MTLDLLKSDETFTKFLKLVWKNLKLRLIS